MSFPKLRPRRLRSKKVLRQLVSETSLSVQKIVMPLFIKEGIKSPEPITSMPGYLRYPVESCPEVVRDSLEVGIKSFLVFGIPSYKDDIGTQAFSKDGVVQRSIRLIRKELGDDVNLITDVCMCQYTTHGHCGIIKRDRNGKLAVDNEATLNILSKIAVSQADAGADLVAPSSMTDGMVLAIREGLDKEGFEDVAIMSYSAKYASCFYASFREAAYSAPQFGDRRGYQMSFHNAKEALKEIRLDIEEGADIVMVKPALAYLDIINIVKQSFPEYPLAAYNVSGEYSMVKAASERGWLDEKRAVYEILTAITRAGADIIITYHAMDLARWLKEGLDVF